MFFRVRQTHKTACSHKKFLGLDFERQSSKRKWEADKLEMRHISESRLH